MIGVEERLLQSVAPGKSGGEVSDEAVTRSGRVEHVDCMARQTKGPFVGHGHRPTGAVSHDDDLPWATEVVDAVSGARPFAPGQRGQLSFVDDNDIRVLQQRGGARLHRRWVEDRASAARAGVAEERRSGSGRDLELSDGNVTGCHLDIRHLSNRQSAVGAGDDDDAVLACGLDNDYGGTAGTIESGHGVHGDATLDKEPHELRTESVAADTADHCRLRTCHGGGDRLVGSLASWMERERGTRHRLARTRRPRRHGHDIHVDRSGHDNPSHDPIILDREGTTVTGTIDQ